MTEDSKNIIRRYQDAYNSGDLDALDDILDPAWVSNAWPEGVEQTIEAAKEMHRMASSVFPDMHTTTDQLVAEGDRVVQCWTFRGTHKGDLPGFPATGRQIKTAGISVFRVADGRIVEHQAYSDELGFLVQLGAEFPSEWSLFGHRTP